MKLSKYLIVAGALLLTACGSEQTPSGSRAVSAGTTAAEAFTQEDIREGIDSEERAAPAEERKKRKALVPAEQLKTKKALLPAEERKKKRALLPAKQRKKSRQEQALPKQELPITEAVRHNQLY